MRARSFVISATISAEPTMLAAEGGGVNLSPRGPLSIGVNQPAKPLSALCFGERQRLERGVNATTNCLKGRLQIFFCKIRKSRRRCQDCFGCLDSNDHTSSHLEIYRGPFR